MLRRGWFGPGLILAASGLLVFGLSRVVRERPATWRADGHQARTVRELDGDGSQEQALVTGAAMDVLFDSREHPDPALAQLAEVERGLLAGPNEVIVADAATIVAVNIATGSVRTAGGAGEGPGDFSRTPDLAKTPDGFAAWDRGMHRLTRFSVAGELVNVATLPAAQFAQASGQPNDRLAPLLAAANPPVLLGVFSDGALVFVRDRLGVPEGIGRGRVALLEVSQAGEVRQLFDVPGAEVQTSRAPGRSSSGAVVFGHNTHVAFVGDRIVIADTQSEEVELRSRDGTVVRSFPMPGERRAVTEEQVEAKVAAAREAREEIPAEIRARFPGLEAPRPHNSVAPPVDAVMADHGGRIWARDYMMPGAEVQRWTVWEPGRNTFEVELSAGERLLDADADRILVRIREQDGDRVQVRRGLLARAQGSGGLISPQRDGDG